MTPLEAINILVEDRCDNDDCLGSCEYLMNPWPEQQGQPSEEQRKEAADLLRKLVGAR